MKLVVKKNVITDCLNIFNKNKKKFKKLYNKNVTRPTKNVIVAHSFGTSIIDCFQRLTWLWRTHHQKSQRILNATRKTMFSWITHER